jgi:hypothetical protein
VSASSVGTVDWVNFAWSALFESKRSDDLEIYGLVSVRSSGVWFRRTR